MRKFTFAKIVIYVVIILRTTEWPSNSNSHMQIEPLGFQYFLEMESLLHIWEMILKKLIC